MDVNESYCKHEYLYNTSSNFFKALEFVFNDISYKVGIDNSIATFALEVNKSHSRPIFVFFLIDRLDGDLNSSGNWLEIFFFVRELFTSF